MFWKVCRIQDLATARLCAEVGADFLGLHAIHNLSQRCCKLYARITKELSDYYPSTQAVLVTKQDSSAKLAKILLRTKIKYIQLHIPVDDPKHIFGSIEREVHSPLNFIGVLSASESSARTRLISRPPKSLKFYLLDSGWRGGTGTVPDEARTKRLLKAANSRKTFLAGGLNPINVQRFIKKYSPGGVDVQSGLEVPGTKSKDPMLVIRFAQAVKGKTRKRDYLCPRRPLVSVALTSISENSTNYVIKRFRRTDIDQVHLDHSDGSIAQRFISQPFYVASALRKLSPCLPYDVHLFVNNPNDQRDVLKQYLKLNPLLRMVYFHWAELETSFRDRIENFESMAGGLGVGAGVALHSTKFNVVQLGGLLTSLQHSSILDVSLITHSSSHTLEKVLLHDLPNLRLLSAWAAEQKKRIHISVDRNMNYDKLRALSTGLPTHVIVGENLLLSRRPQVLIRRLRSLLQMPESRM
jgi:phosphoribosylanthranilate isomerase